MNSSPPFTVYTFSCRLHATSSNHYGDRLRDFCLHLRQRHHRLWWGRTVLLGQPTESCVWFGVRAENDQYAWLLYHWAQSNVFDVHFCTLIHHVFVVVVVVVVFFPTSPPWIRNIRLPVRFVGTFAEALFTRRRHIRSHVGILRLNFLLLPSLKLGPPAVAALSYLLFFLTVPLGTLMEGTRNQRRQGRTGKAFVSVQLWWSRVVSPGRNG